MRANKTISLFKTNTKSKPQKETDKSVSQEVERSSCRQNFDLLKRRPLLQVQVKGLHFCQVYLCGGLED